MAEQNGNGGKNGQGQRGALKDLVQAESMVQLALALPIGCLVGWFLGGLLDKHFHTSWIATVGLVLGAAGGFVQIITVARRFLHQEGQ